MGLLLCRSCGVKLWCCWIITSRGRKNSVVVLEWTKSHRGFGQEGEIDPNAEVVVHGVVWRWDVVGPKWFVCNHSWKKCWYEKTFKPELSLSDPKKNWAKLSIAQNLTFGDNAEKSNLNLEKRLGYCSYLRELEKHCIIRMDFETVSVKTLKVVGIRISRMKQFLLISKSAYYTFWKNLSLKSVIVQFKINLEFNRIKWLGLL